MTATDEVRPADAATRRRSEADGPALSSRMQVRLEETTVPSPNVTDLERNPVNDYLTRLSARAPHVAELFQENTKISPHSTVNAPLQRPLLDATRAWYVSTSYRPVPGDFDRRTAVPMHVLMPVSQLGPELEGLLTDLADADPDLLYSLDFWLLLDREVFRLPPRSPDLWLERRLEAGELERLRAAVLGVGGDDVRSAQALLFVVPVPWRYMIFQGPRGYRRSLVDVGRVLAWMDRTAVTRGISATWTIDFHDATVDEALWLDGVERSVGAIVLLTTTTEGSRET